VSESDPVEEEVETVPPEPPTETLGSLELDHSQILQTIEHLKKRIEERFPGRGLTRICGRLREIAARTQETVEWVARPILWLRASSAALLLLIGAGLLGTLFSLSPHHKVLTLLEFIQALESGINDLILIGAGVFFLVSLEVRTKRKRALAAVHDLRSLVHIIDMHQLTKDPERLQPEHSATASSPSGTMTAYELNRYLDYCSEMLSLCAKLAAIYAQNFADPVTLSAVGEVENLAIGLSNNIWQKIAILQALPSSEYTT
jgi:hypothetical protein